MINATRKPNAGNRRRPPLKQKWFNSRVSGQDAMGYPRQSFTFSAIAFEV